MAGSPEPDAGFGILFENFVDVLALGMVIVVYYPLSPSETTHHKGL